MTQVPRYLTATQVAERLEVSPETVREWARSGKLPHILLPSGVYKFRREAIDAIDGAPATTGSAA